MIYIFLIAYITVANPQFYYKKTQKLINLIFVYWQYNSMSALNMNRTYIKILTVSRSTVEL